MPLKDILFGFFQTLFLSLAVLFSFYWFETPRLSAFSAQLIGLLTLSYLINYFQKTKKPNSFSKILDSLIISIVILLVVLTTGGLNSPATPLIFILAVFISLMHNTLTAIIIITLIGILLERDSTLRGISTDTFQIYVWLIIPPIISIISKQYIRLLEDRQKIKVLKTEEKIFENQVTNIKNYISSFSQRALDLLEQNNLRKLKEEVQSLPDKIDEKASK